MAVQLQDGHVNPILLRNSMIDLDQLHAVRRPCDVPVFCISWAAGFQLPLHVIQKRFLAYGIWISP